MQARHHVREGFHDQEESWQPKREGVWITPLNSPWRDRLIYVGAAICASVIGILIAQGWWIFVGLVGVAVAGIVLAALVPQRTHYTVFSVLIVGYILGNRGFAQLSPLTSAPLFPAELGLGLSTGLLLAQCTPARRLPISEAFALSKPGPA